jgi:hypothetical protein
MDENQSPQQDNQAPEPSQTPVPNVYEPQPRIQPTATPEQPKPVKSRKKSFIVLLVILLLLGAVGAAAYFMTQDDMPAPADTSQTTEVKDEESTEPTEEAETDLTYQSKLYPDLSFTVPEGWEVTEPDTYADNSFGEGSADGTITVTNGDVTLKLDLQTVPATGFEGYTCYNREGLTAVGDVYRFVDPDGITAYVNGISETDDEWAEVIADEGNFTSFEDPDPNYCVSFPFIGTYSSTLNQAEYPDYPYGFTDQQKALVWMSATIEGTPTEAQLVDADAIIKSLSQPDLDI